MKPKRKPALEREALHLLKQLKRIKASDILKGVEYRNFISYENSDKEQIFRLELMKYPQSDITFIIRKIIYFKGMESIISPTYKNYISGENDFGALRINDFRIYIHRESKDKWIMLHIFRKTTKKTPEKETLIALNRLKEYKSQKK